MKFIIIERQGEAVTGYVTAPYYNISGDRKRAKVFESGLDASVTAFALHKQFKRCYEVKGIDDEL